jgi:hypothetical protein
MAEAESPNRVKAATVNAADGPENVSAPHDFGVQARPETVERALGTVQQPQLPSLDVGLDEIGPRRRHNLLSDRAPAL